jgi:hypothetical protein
MLVITTARIRWKNTTYSEEQTEITSGNVAANTLSKFFNFTKIPTRNRVGTTYSRLYTVYGTVPVLQTNDKVCKPSSPTSKFQGLKSVNNA